VTDVLHVVFAGHLDHGKSTLLGAMARGLRRHGVSVVPEGTLAFEADQLTEEREGKLTIESTQVLIDRPEGRLVLIDAPGHEEFLHNMLTGATRAEAVVLVVAADEGVLDQTRRHAVLCSLLGIPAIVAVAKMDVVGYDRATFADRCAEVASALALAGTTAEAMIPVSAESGDNVMASASAMPWYEGPTLVEALGTLRLRPDRMLSDARFIVQDVYRRDSRPVVAGRVVAGTISAGDEMSLCPGGVSCKAECIWRFPGDLQAAETGECVGLGLVGVEAKRGDVLAKGDAPWVGRRIAARAFWLADVPLRPGDAVVWRTATQAAAAEVVDISDRMATGALSRVNGTAELQQFDLGTVVVLADVPLVLESYVACPELGRFVLEREGMAVGAGVINGELLTGGEKEG